MNAGSLRGVRAVLHNAKTGYEVLRRACLSLAILGVAWLLAMGTAIDPAHAFCYPCSDASIPAACECIIGLADERTGLDTSCTCLGTYDDDDDNEGGEVGDPHINQYIGIATPPVNPIRNWSNGRMGEMQIWLLGTFFEENILPALMEMTTQMSAVALYQVSIIGTFLDAKQQMETQRLFQSMNAEAFRDYAPSEGLCTIATLFRSVPVSDQIPDATVAALSQGSIKRQLLNANRNAADGTAWDHEGRMRQFRATYCDRRDNNDGLETVCGAGVAQLRKNRDIDYTRSFADPDTLDLDFLDPALSNGEADVMALAANLYAHDVFPTIPSAVLSGSDTSMNTYLDMRAVTAKRSVAEQSFYAIAALKSHSAVTPESRVYMLALLQEMGFPQAEAEAMLAENPSWMAQMDLLTRKMAQRPEFYVDLVDKPVNVARKSVALRSLSMLQKRELFKSALRSEAIISILLELAVMDEQDRALNRANRIVN